MDYSGIVARLKASYTKEQLKYYDQIVEFDSLKLASMGHNDTEGYQIFTPEFIVKDMCAAIGNDIFDFSKNVLEPTSGDGAFTVYILSKRLEKAFKGGNFELDSLRALSTIYSIEMDEELIIKQRNNVFTLFKLFTKKHKIEVADGYFEFVKCMILSNFMWAMFNEDPDTQSMALFNAEVDIAFAMPNAEKNKKNDNYLLMPVWEITESDIDVHEEGVESC